MTIEILTGGSDKTGISYSKYDSGCKIYYSCLSCPLPKCELERSGENQKTKAYVPPPAVSQELLFNEIGDLKWDDFTVRPAARLERITLPVEIRDSLADMKPSDADRKERKKRWRDSRTEEQKEATREKWRQWYKNKKKVGEEEMNKKQYAEMTEDQKERRREYQRKWAARKKAASISAAAAVPAPIGEPTVYSLSQVALDFATGPAIYAYVIAARYLLTNYMDIRHITDVELVCVTRLLGELETTMRGSR